MNNNNLPQTESSNANKKLNSQYRRETMQYSIYPVFKKVRL